MKKAVIYVRVSSSQQVENGLSIEAQLNQLYQYAKQNNYQISKDYIDYGQSARSDKRPQFQAMIQEIKSNKNKYDTVLIHKIDRFARNRRDSVLYKSLLRKECGVEVISITEEFGEGPIGKMVEGILESVAEFYSENLAKEVKKGQLEKAKLGQAVGKPPFGYQINSQTGKYQIEAGEAEIIQYIFEKYIEGQGSRKISQNLKTGIEKFGKAAFKKSTGEIMKWNNVTILKILKNKSYIGTFSWQQIVIENNHPPLIDKQKFKLVQKLIKQRKNRNISQKYKSYLLQGLLKCYECEGSLSRQITRQDNKRYNYTRCINNQTENNCYSNLNRIEKIEKEVLQALKRLLITNLSLDKLQATLDSSQLKAEYQALKIKLEKFDEKFQRQMKAYENKIISLEELQNSQNRLNKEKNLLETKLNKNQARLQKKNLNKTNLSSELNNLKIFSEKDSLSLEKKQKNLTKVIKEIRLSKKKKIIEIIYNL